MSAQEEYNPASPAYRARTPPNVNDAKKSPKQAPRSPPYVPSSPGYYTGSPKNENSPKPTTRNTFFPLEGNPYQPINPNDMGRPVVTKAVRCNECRGQSSYIDIEEYVPSFLLRRKDEPPIPHNTTNKPWWWTQAFCVGCQYTFRVKINLPDLFFDFCTLDRYPPAKPKDGIKKYSNGVTALAFAVDKGPMADSDVVRQRQANKRFRGGDQGDIRSDRNSSYSRHDLPSSYNRRTGSPPYPPRSPPWTMRSPPRRQNSGNYRDRSRERGNGGRGGYEGSSRETGYGQSSRDHRGQYQESARYPPQQYAAQAQFYDAGQQYGSQSHQQTTAPPSQSYQQYVPELHAPIPAPNVNMYSQAR